MAKNPDPLKPDKLSEAELAKRYGYALRIIKSDPEIYSLFLRAANAKRGQWTAERFQAELLDTQWWAENSEFARRALTAEAMGGADWESMLETAGVAVQAEATNQGVPLTPEQIRDLAEQTIANGWDQQGRGQLLATAIAQYTQQAAPDEFMAGGAGDLQQRLMAVAAANGLELSQSYFASAAQSVASNLTTADDWERQIREQASSFYAEPWREKIMAGVDARVLADGYINRMAQAFEIDPSSVSLNDPLLREAFTKMNDKGEPTVESLWAFEKRLRSDARWMNTRQAAMEIAQTARSVMETFGVMK